MVPGMSPPPFKHEARVSSQFFLMDSPSEGLPIEMLPDSNGFVHMGMGYLPSLYMQGAYMPATTSNEWPFTWAAH